MKTSPEVINFILGIILYIIGSLFDLGFIKFISYVFFALCLLSLINFLLKKSKKKENSNKKIETQNSKPLNTKQPKTTDGLVSDSNALNTMPLESQFANYEPQKYPYDLRDYFRNYQINNPDVFEAIVTLNWLDGKPFPADYPSYFYYALGIEKPQSFQAKMIEDGMLIKPEPKQFLETLKVTQLKDILRENALKVSGKKSELVERILNGISEDDIKRIRDNYEKAIYILSQEARDLIGQNNGALLLFSNRQHWNIGSDYYREVVNRINNANFSDVMNYIVNEGLANKVYSSQLILNQYLEETKQYSELVLQYVIMAFEEANELWNSELMYNTDPLPSQYGQDEHYLIAPYINNSIRDYKDYYEDQMVDYIYEMAKGNYVIPKYQFKKMIEDAMNGTAITYGYAHQLLDK